MLTNSASNNKQIQDIMRSDAYLKSWHTEYKEAQTKVRSWFESQYKTKPATNPWSDLGDTLLVGERNLSFARGLCQNENACGITSLLATVFEKENDVSQDALTNALIIEKNNGKILYDIDATRLGETFKSSSFDTIIFQFPNVASRDPKYGRNPNHILMRRFLKTSKNLLSQKGRIFVTTVDNDYYEGVFNLEEACQYAGLNHLKTYPFYLKDFPGYTHINTDNSKSALKDYNHFKSWVFTLS